MAEENVTTPKLALELIRVETKYNKAEQLSRTIGLLLVNGQFMSNTLEDFDYGFEQKSATEVSVKKVKGQQQYKKKVAIPTGTYPVRLIKSPKFGHNAIAVENVTGFTDIRIHGGASSKFTEGCILAGLNAQVSENLLTDYNTLPFDQTINSKKSQKAGKWTPAWLQTLIQNAGGQATLTISRRYPSKEFVDQLVHQKNDTERLNWLRRYEVELALSQYLNTIVQTPDHRISVAVHSFSQFTDFVGAVVSSSQLARPTQHPRSRLKQAHKNVGQGGGQFSKKLPATGPTFKPIATPNHHAGEE